MAREELTLASIAMYGLEQTMTALIADGHKFRNDGQRTRLTVVNGATPFTLTIITAVEVDDLAVADRTVNVGANERIELGPFPRSIYNQDDGRVYIDYSDVTDGVVGVANIQVLRTASPYLLTEAGEPLLRESGGELRV